MKLIKIFISFLALSAIAGLSLGLYSTENPAETLSNYQNTYQCHPAVIHTPNSVDEVQQVVLDAIANGQTVMTGSRKFASQIDAACAGDGQVQITLENMDGILAFDAEEKTVSVEAGMRFNVLNEFLRDQKLAINMVTELNIFTLGGMLGSGTHGSTLTKASNMIADYVTQLTIVNGLGEVRIITGEDLNAARVNLGVLGVVVEVTLALEPAFKVLADVQGYRDDTGFENRILDIARDNYSANIAWFPGIGRYTTTLYNPMPLESEGNAYNAQADVSDTQEFFFGLLFNALHELPGSGLQCLAAKIRYGARDSSYYRDLDTGKVVDHPIGHSDQMQYFECKDPDACVWDKLPIALQEVAIPLEELPNWILDVREILAASEKTCFPLNGIYFRFGKASSSYLGMSAGRDTAYLGIEYTLRQEGKAVPKNYFVNLEIEQMSIRKYGARPHWGKNSVAIFENMPEKFDKWDEFMAFKNQMDPQNIFTNPFWERIKGEDSLDNYLTPECNARGECYCQLDEHCAQGTSCQAGTWYSDARICK